MKKILLSQLILTLTLFASAQDTSTTMQKATADICSCLSKIKVDTSNIKQYKSAALTCFTTGAMEHIVTLAEERNIDVADNKAMRGLGIEIGKELIKEKCPGYITFAKITAEEKEETKTDVEEHTTSGKLVKVDKKEFVYLVVKDHSNRDYNFIWMEYFNGSEKFFGNKLDALVGKNITISWTEKEVYMPKANNYFKLKEIMGIQLATN